MGLCPVILWYIAGNHVQLYATPNLRYWPLGLLRQIYAIGLKGLMHLRPIELLAQRLYKEKHASIGMQHACQSH